MCLTVLTLGYLIKKVKSKEALFVQEKFDVEFTFVGGDKYTFTDYQSGSYVHVVNEIKASENGWFGVAGEVVNLANVTSAKVIEK
jgi:hypothetical protein